VQVSSVADYSCGVVGQIVDFTVISLAVPDIQAAGDATERAQMGPRSLRGTQHLMAGLIRAPAPGQHCAALDVQLHLDHRTGYNAPSLKNAIPGRGRPS